MHCWYMPATWSAYVFALLAVTISQGGKWTYTGPDGAQHWSKRYPFCGGVFQSPIDLHTQLLEYDPTIAPIEVQNYNLSAQEQLTLGNNGHSGALKQSIQTAPRLHSDASFSAVKLSLPSRMHISGLPHRYSAAQLHFHWGSPSLPSGSEHTINGKQFAAEMHVVHFNSDKYANLSIAADKSDGLAVLAVLIEVGAFNPAFDQFLKYVNGIKYRDQKVQVQAFNIRTLLPAHLDEFYRYDGSLTTPPCYPSVLWTVFRNPVTISNRQFQMLATSLYSSREWEHASVALSGNYRKPQHTYDRTVLVSFQEGRGLQSSLTVTPTFIRRQIIQQLLAGDIADLADEGISWLLPKLSRKPRVNKKLTSFEKQPSKSQKLSKTNVFVPSLWKTSRNPSNVGKHYEGSLSYVALEQKVIRQLKRPYTEDQLAEALKEVVFPELNLRSYLDCRSELALPTIRYLLRGRPSDEAAELEQSLAKAAMGQKSLTTPHMGPATAVSTGLTQTTVQKNPYNKPRPHHRPQQVEWED